MLSHFTHHGLPGRKDCCLTIIRLFIASSAFTWRSSQSAHSIFICFLLTQPTYLKGSAISVNRIVHKVLTITTLTVQAASVSVPSFKSCQRRSYTQNRERIKLLRHRHGSKLWSLAVPLPSHILSRDTATQLHQPCTPTHYMYQRVGRGGQYAYVLGRSVKWINPG